MIWCDLDETLVWVRSANPQQPCPPGHRAVIVDGNRYLACARPHVRVFLGALRRIDTVRLLTLSERRYALAVNRVCCLGFRPRQIVAREFLDAARIDPRAVLVQEKIGPRQTDETRLKTAYLGIGAERVVRVEPFWGNMDERFRWREVVRDVQGVWSMTDAEEAELRLSKREQLERLLTRENG